MGWTFSWTKFVGSRYRPLLGSGSRSSTYLFHSFILIEIDQLDRSDFFSRVETEIRIDRFDFYAKNVNLHATPPPFFPSSPHLDPLHFVLFPSPIPPLFNSRKPLPFSRIRRRRPLNETVPRHSHHSRDSLHRRTSSTPTFERISSFRRVGNETIDEGARRGSEETRGT